jgi:hypothetical protein
MITVRPQKFAISFVSAKPRLLQYLLFVCYGILCSLTSHSSFYAQTMGSLTFMGSFAILKGPADHLKSMCSRNRIVFTTIYVGSMLSTLYFTFTVGGPQGYVVVLASSGAQLLALAYYLVSFLPGGAAGLRILTAAMWKLLQPVLIMCAKFQAICIARCCSFWVKRR